MTVRLYPILFDRMNVEPINAAVAKSTMARLTHSLTRSRYTTNICVDNEIQNDSLLFWCVVFDAHRSVSMRNLFVFAFNRTECWFYCRSYCTIDTWTHVIHPYEWFEIKLNWEENTKIVSRFYCVKISRLRIFLPQIYIECVCACARMWMCASAFTTLSMCYILQTGFSPTDNKNNRNVKALVILGFCDFPHTRTRTLMCVARTNTLPKIRHLLWLLFIYAFRRANWSWECKSGFVQYARLWATTIISNWWFSRNFDFEKMWKWYTTFHV